MAQIITPSVLEATYTAFNLLYQQAFQATSPWYSRIATPMPSTTGSETYAWMKELPGLREWVGERQAIELVERGQVLKNKPFEMTVKVPADRIEDETIGAFNPMFQMMGRAAAKWPDEVVASALKAGVTALAFDGQPFFNASHPVDMDDPGKGTYSNNKTSFALTEENYSTARAEFRSRVNDAGKPMGLSPDLLIVPPQLEDTAKRILTTDLLIRSVGSGVAADQNIQKGTAEILTIEELADQPTTWYLACTKLPVKPLVWQLRKAPVMTALTQATAENVFWRQEYVYGVNARGNAGFSLPFLITRCTA
ncbi:hypothetical protein [Myxococcus phage Mx4 ts27htf-1hrm-1]|nr:putative major capsid protein [Myxococcus phage Mx4]WNM70389.1 hypothetical protein [Myxococcus phage Mx4 ts27htf-1hrm-1]